MKLHSASKSDTDHVRLWQTCHLAYCWWSWCTITRALGIYYEGWKTI